jgi:hypothetical protein
MRYVTSARTTLIVVQHSKVVEAAPGVMKTGRAGEERTTA